MNEAIVTALIVLAGIEACVFMVQYLRRRPWRTRDGRLILGFMGSIGLILVTAVVYRLAPGSPAWHSIRVVSWTLINVIMIGAVIVVTRSGRRAPVGPSRRTIDCPNCGAVLGVTQ